MCYLLPLHNNYDINKEASWGTINLYVMTLLMHSLLQTSKDNKKAIQDLMKSYENKYSISRHKYLHGCKDSVLNQG